MENQKKETKRRHGMGRILILVVLLFGAFAIGSWANTKKENFGSHSSYSHGANHGHSSFDTKRIKHLLKKVDASPEQEARITTIAADIEQQMALSRASQDAQKQRIIEALTSESLDNAALEKIRGNWNKQLETESEIVFGAIISMAEVLTPEQRKDLIGYSKSYQ